VSPRIKWTAVEVLAVDGTAVTVGTPDEHGGMATLVLEPPHVQPHFLPEVGSTARVLKIDNVPFIYPDAITDAAGLAVKATDPITGQPYEAAVIGSSTAVFDADGLRAGIDADGVGHFTGLDVTGWPTVAAADYTGRGGRLDAILDRRPRGLVAYGTHGVTATGTDSANGIGFFEIRGDLVQGRQYKLCTSDINLKSTVAGDTVRLRIMQTSAVRGTLPASPGVAAGASVAGASGVAGSDVTIAELLPPLGEGAQTRRWLLVYARTSGTGLASIAGREGVGGVQMWVEDIGPSRVSVAVANDGGSDGLGGGGAPAPVPPVARTLTVAASWVENYSDGTLITDTTTAVQGQTPLQRMRRAKIGFPALTALTGATITGVQLRLNAVFWATLDGGTAAVGFHGDATPTGVQGDLTAEDAFRVPDWPRATTRLLDLMPYAPQEWVSGVKSGIRLGGDVGTDSIFYGRFSGPAEPDLSLRPELTFTYTV